MAEGSERKADVTAAVVPVEVEELKLADSGELTIAPDPPEPHVMLTAGSGGSGRGNGPPLVAGGQEDDPDDSGGQVPDPMSETAFARILSADGGVGDLALPNEILQFDESSAIGASEISLGSAGEVPQEIEPRQWLWAGLAGVTSAAACVALVAVGLAMTGNLQSIVG